MHKKCVINKTKNPVVTGLKVSNALRVLLVSRDFGRDVFKSNKAQRALL